MQFCLGITKNIPFSTKKELREQFNKLYIVHPKLKRIYPNTSGGSTGEPTKFMQDNYYSHREIESFILVTSKYHSSRSKKIFRKALSGLDREISIYSSPSKYDPFNASQWWKDREDMKCVVLEYLKLAHFYFWEQFLLD